MKSIEERVLLLEGQMAALMMQNAVNRADGTGTRRPVTSTAGSPGAVASDADLDGQFGDVTIRKDPPRWTGESYAGRKYSECPPDYLDSLAGFLDWCADREEVTAGKEKYAAYSRRDAGRARGWAVRMRARGAVAAPAAPAADYPPDWDEAADAAHF